MKKQIDEIRLSLHEDYDLNQICATTVYLQEDFLEEIQFLCAQWYRRSKRVSDGKKLSNSAIFRVVLEFVMPLLLTMDDVTDENDFR